MASKKVNIGIDTTADTSGAKQATVAMDALADANTKAAAASTASSAATRNVGNVALQAGYQVQDLATQVAAGTSAFTAFAQNAPQFLGAFGPGGAIAGALLAVGALATKVFLDMGDDAKSASEKAEELADAIEKIGENAAASIRDDIDFGREKLDESKTAAQNFADEVANAARNQINYNATVLKSFQDLLAAEETLRDLKGETTSKVKDLATEEKAAAEARAAATQIDIDRENLKLQTAQNNVAVQQNALEEEKKRKAEKEASLQKERETLQALRDQLELLKQQSKERGSMAGATGMLPGVTISTPTPGQTAAARAAETQLKDPVLATRLSVLENSIKQLEESISGEISKNIAAQAQNLIAAESNLRQTESDVSFAVDAITKVAENKEAIEKAKLAAEKAKAFATEIETMIAGVEPANQQQEKALEDVKTFLKDGQITQNEIAKTTASLTTLSPLIKQAITNNTTSVTQLISIMNGFKNETQGLQRQIDALKSRGTTPQPGSSR